MNYKSSLTDEQAEDLLQLLSHHFGEPVKPVSRYCNSLREWQKAHLERTNRLMEEAFPGIVSEKFDTPKQRAARKLKWDTFEKIKKRSGPVPSWAAEEAYAADQFLDTLHNVNLQISKSDLLYRLIYCDEKIRSTMCPEHKGHWSGLEWDGNRCPHGCQLTGWLPEDDKKERKQIASVEISYEVELD